MNEPKRKRGQPKRGTGSTTISISMSEEEKRDFLASSNEMNMGHSEFFRFLYTEWQTWRLYQGQADEETRQNMLAQSASGS